MLYACEVLYVLITRENNQRITSALQHLQLNYTSCNVKDESLTFIYFQQNYQTADIYFYSYHVISLNKTISNLFCQPVYSNFIP